MNEKEMFLATWARESATTLKILKQLPADKADFTPTKEKTKSAKALAEMFVIEFGVIEGALNGKIEFTPPKLNLATYADVLTAFEATYSSLIFEMGFGQSRAARALLGPGWVEVQSFADLLGILRVIAAKLLR